MVCRKLASCSRRGSSLSTVSDSPPGLLARAAAANASFMGARMGREWALRFPAAILLRMKSYTRFSMWITGSTSPFISGMEIGFTAT
jgi:hypothetical protein